MQTEECKLEQSQRIWIPNSTFNCKTKCEINVVDVSKLLEVSWDSSIYRKHTNRFTWLILKVKKKSEWVKERLDRYGPKLVVKYLLNNKDIARYGTYHQ